AVVAVFISHRAARPLRSALLPYTTLFRSQAGRGEHEPRRRGERGAQRGGEQLDQLRRHLRGRGGQREHERLHPFPGPHAERDHRDRKSTRLNSSHVKISYAVFCLKKKKKT